MVLLWRPFLLGFPRGGSRVGPDLPGEFPGLFRGMLPGCKQTARVQDGLGGLREGSCDPRGSLGSGSPQGPSAALLGPVGFNPRPEASAGREKPVEGLSWALGVRVRSRGSPSAAGAAPTCAVLTQLPGTFSLQGNFALRFMDCDALRTRERGPGGASTGRPASPALPSSGGSAHLPRSILQHRAPQA